MKKFLRRVLTIIFLASSLNICYAKDINHNKEYIDKNSSVVNNLYDSVNIQNSKYNFTLKNSNQASSLQKFKSLLKTSMENRETNVVINYTGMDCYYDDKNVNIEKIKDLIEKILDEDHYLKYSIKEYNIGVSGYYGNIIIKFDFNYLSTKRGNRHIWDVEEYPSAIHQYDPSFVTKKINKDESVNIKLNVSNNIIFNIKLNKNVDIKKVELFDGDKFLQSTDNIDYKLIFMDYKDKLEGKTYKLKITLLDGTTCFSNVRIYPTSEVVEIDNKNKLVKVKSLIDGQLSINGNISGEVKKGEILTMYKEQTLVIVPWALEENIMVTRAEQDKMMHMVADIQGKATRLTSEVEEHDEVIKQIKAIK